MTLFENNHDQVDTYSTIKILFHNITVHFEQRFNSWFMAITMFSIGIVLSINHNALTSTDHTYFEHMLRYANHDVWRAVFLIIGTTRLMTLVINGSFPGVWWTPHLRMFMAGISSVIWCQVAISSVLVDNPTIGAVVYPGLFFLELRNTWRAARETRMSDLHGGSLGDWS